MLKCFFFLLLPLFYLFIIKIIDWNYQRWAQDQEPLFQCRLISCILLISLLGHGCLKLVSFKRKMVYEHIVPTDIFSKMTCQLYFQFDCIFMILCFEVIGNKCDTLFVCIISIKKSGLCHNISIMNLAVS